MADEILYTVSSCTEDEVPVKAQLDGQTVEAKVRCLVVEATSSDGSMGHTFRLRGAKAEDYAVGSKFSTRLTPIK